MIRWFAGHPTAANLLLVLLLAAGLFAAPQLKRETFPDYRPTEVSIEVVYRGASAADVEDAICRRLHDAVKGVDFLDELRCVAQDNLASATATMTAGGDVLRFLDELQTEVRALDTLPDRAEAPVIRESRAPEPGPAAGHPGNRRPGYPVALHRAAPLTARAGVTGSDLRARGWRADTG